MKKFRFLPLFFAALLFLVASCEKLEPAAPAEDEVLDGQVAGLTMEQNALFLAGDVAFNSEVFTREVGLGPLFVATSCGSCHAGDGKGTPFTTLVRYGQSAPGENQFLHLGGPQLQNRALPGFAPEQIPAGATFSSFNPPAVTGLGFLEFVTDADLLALADPTDSDGDGISGVPNWKPLPGYILPKPDAIEQDGKYIHRFGKKAAAYNLMHQTVGAYNQDMGIASNFEPMDVYSGLEIDPEVSSQTIHNVTSYLQMLKAPIQRTPDAAGVVLGKAIFGQIGCASCHQPTLKTGYSHIEALSFKEFHPYSDMLLHDMGSELDDHYTEGSAETYEWRTPPLWGLGLQPNSQGGQYFLLHDGRAHSIQEAILLHGGEAENSRSQFNALSASEQSALIEFLKSL